jgi:hypothetical protein
MQTQGSDESPMIEKAIGKELLFMRLMGRLPVLL